jgi:hypothetical protein
MAARAGQNSQGWKDRYAIRAAVGGTIAQATRGAGIRHAPATSARPKTRLEHNAPAATAINVTGLDAWWTGKPSTGPHHLPAAARLQPRRV